MLLGRAIQGFGASGPYIACMSIIRDKFSGAEMARVMSFVMMVFIMIPVIAPALGQGIMLLTSWNFIFVLYVGYSIAVLIWITISLQETLPPEIRVPFSLKNIHNGIRKVFSNKKTVLYTVCMGLVFGALIGDLNSAPQVFQGQFGVGKMFVVYFGLQALAFGLSSVVNAKFVEKYGMDYICLRAFIIIAVSSIIFLLMHFICEIKFYMYFIYGLILMFCCGMLFGNLNSLAMEPMGEIAGLASAIISFFSSIISTISGTIIGQMYDGTLIPILIGFIILSITAFILNYTASRLSL